MRRIALLSAIPFFLLPFACVAQQSPATPYKVLSVTKIGGDGGFDYVYADNAARRLYIPRLGAGG